MDNVTFLKAEKAFSGEEAKDEAIAYAKSKDWSKAERFSCKKSDLAFMDKVGTVGDITVFYQYAGDCHLFVVEPLIVYSDYIAHDENGEYIRKAVTLGELPYNKVDPTAEALLELIQAKIGEDATDRLKFGLWVYNAFGMYASDAEKHQHKELLLTRVSELPLKVRHYSGDS